LSIHAKNLARIVQWISSYYSLWDPLNGSPSFSDWLSLSDILDEDEEEFHFHSTSLSPISYSLELNRDSFSLIPPDGIIKIENRIIY
jgi:hypothetical protein